MQLFDSLKLLMALLGSSCPLFGRSGPKVGPKMVPKNAQKRNQKLSFFLFFYVEVNISQHKKEPRAVLEHTLDQHFCKKFKTKLQKKPG